MRKILAREILSKFQKYRRNGIPLDKLNITPIQIGEALDVAIDVLDLSTVIDGTPSRTNKKYEWKK